MGASRVSKVLAFLESAESTCAATDVVAEACASALATVDELLVETADLLGLFAALELCEATAHKLATP